MTINSIVWDGKPISKPGMYAKIPLPRYHQPKLCVGPSVSSSGLRLLFNRSPAHFFADWCENPRRSEAAKEKKHFIVGRAVHHLILGEPNFSRHFIIRPEYVQGVQWQSNRTVCRRWVEDQQKAGRTVLTRDDVQDIQGMAISLGREPLVQQGILRGRIERSLIWQDKATGIWLKARPDAIPTMSGDFADLKTAKEVGKDWDFQDLRYDFQGALVRMGARALGIPFSSFTLVYVEKTDPWVTDIAEIHQTDLDEAEKDARMAIDTLAYCLKTKRWFGPMGSQRDARRANFSDKLRENAKFRREDLTREIAA